MPTTEYPIHPAACLGPLDDARIERLAKGMTEVGFLPQFPLIIHEGQLVDGRGRQAAARLADVTPVTKQLRLPKGVDIAKWVLEANEHRQPTRTQKQCYLVKMRPDLSSGEIALMIGMKAHNKKENRGKFNNDIWRLQSLHRNYPAIFQRLDDGELSKVAAYREAGMNTGHSVNSHVRRQRKLLDQIDRLEAEYDLLLQENKRLIAQIGSEEVCIWCDERFPHGPWCEVINQQAEEIEVWETLANGNTSS